MPHWFEFTYHMLLCKWSLICVCFISHGQKWHLLFLWYFPAASYTGLMYNKSKKTGWLIRTDLGFQLAFSEKQSPLIFFPVYCTVHKPWPCKPSFVWETISGKSVWRIKQRRSLLHERLSESTTASGQQFSCTGTESLLITWNQWAFIYC